MKRFIYSSILLISVLGCGSNPKRGMASSKPAEPVCMEKTTRKQCNVTISGDRVCTCVPDDNEMFQYP